MTSEQLVEAPGHHIGVIPLLDLPGEFLLRCECGWYGAEDEENVDTAKSTHWVDVPLEVLSRSEWP